MQGQLFALYATRASDFFFGSAFCAPIPQALENGIISQQQTSPNFASSSFFAGQTVFDSPLPTSQGDCQSQMYSSQSPLIMRINGEATGRQGQGHTNTLKALKRKLQENFSSTCKPLKVARMVQDRSSGNGLMVPGGTPLPSSFESNSYRNAIGNGSAAQHSVTTGPLQMMYCQGLHTSIISSKHNSIVSDTLPSFVESRRKTPKAPTLEQVVPEITAPVCYPTPDPSPVSSPQPHMKTEPLTDPLIHAVDPILVAKHLCVIRQKQLLHYGQSESTKDMKVESTNKSKLLPSLDVSFVDSFFDEIGTPPGHSPPIKGLLQRVKQEPVDYVTYDCLQSREKQLPDFGKFDLDELLVSSGLQITSSCNNFIDLKMEMDDQRLPVCENHPSPTPSSPRSITDDKMSYDDVLSSVVLTPESEFDTDPCEDLDPDSWMLETCNINTATKVFDLYVEPKLQADFCLKQAGPFSDETELYQLKQLISSWAPSG